MWRAYGDTAIVVKNTPFIQATNLLGVYSVPVNYLSREEFISHINEVASRIVANAEYLRGLGQEAFVYCIHRSFLGISIGTKHPGFAEEKEWRLFYRPNEQTSPLMKLATETIKGVPQIIYKLPLENSPDKGLFNADIPSFLDRIILGPSEYPYMRIRAFQEALRALDVANFDKKVVSSDIPLRTE